MLSASLALVLYLLPEIMGQQEMYREPNGDVVLRSADSALRLIRKFGYAPNQIWKNGFPLLTNDFPGSGVSAYTHNGQDPTQASPNGTTPFNVDEDPFYIQEFAVTQFSFGVTGYFPDFWASLESNDDSVFGYGWKTPYNPGRFAHELNYWERPVIFEGSKQAPSGAIFPGNDLEAPGTLRRYEQGLMAGKVKISLRDADKNAWAGFLIRGNVPSNVASLHDVMLARGVHLVFYRNGTYKAYFYGKDTTTTKLKRLKRGHRLDLIGAGLELEVRCLPGQSVFELYAGGEKIDTIRHPAELTYNPHLGLIANATSGHIWFLKRKFFDLGVKISTVWYSMGNGEFISEQNVWTTDGLPRDFYRAALPAVFLNLETFKPDNRGCYGINEAGERTPIDHILPQNSFKSFFCGSVAGEFGIKGTPERASVDDTLSPFAHVLVSPNAANNEFVILFSPLEAHAVTSAKRFEQVVRWKTEL